MLRIMLVVGGLTIAMILGPGCGSGARIDDSGKEKRPKYQSNMETKVRQLEDENRRLLTRAQDLRAELEQVADREKLHVEALESYTVISIPDRLVFGSGSTRISSDGRRLLSSIAGILNKYQECEARIEGHTDNQQIRPEYQHRFASNWELSASRSAAVVRYLIVAHGINPMRLSAVGRAEYHPIASNDTEEGRAQNRRVEFYIIPMFPTKPLAMENM